MFEKLKKLLNFGDNKSPKQDETSISFSEIQGSSKGSAIIAATLNMLVNEMKKQYPEWSNLFEITPNNGHVLVTCIKGFEDENTKNAIPCLWRRKSFIENCRMMGVKRIIFMDSKNKTFDILNTDVVDVNNLP